MPKLKSRVIDHFEITFIGERYENQDDVLVLTLPNDIYFFAVADGMGGHQGGQIASKEIIKVIKEEIQSAFNQDVETQDLKTILNDIFTLSQQAIKEIINKEPSLSGMGSTLTCLLIYRNNYVWGNIGDSRIYKVMSDGLHQITVDHSAIEEMKKESTGPIPEGIIKKYGNIINRCIDGGDDEPDLFPENDYAILDNNVQGFLLCSDGLIPDRIEPNLKPLENIIRGTRNLEQASKNLVAHAFHSGSTDNITSVLVSTGIKRIKTKIPESVYPPVRINKTVETIVKQKKAGKNRIFILTSFIIILLSLITYLFWPLKQRNTNNIIKKTNNEVIIEENQTPPTVSKESNKNEDKIKWEPFNKNDPYPIIKEKIDWLEYPSPESVDEYIIEIIVEEAETLNYISKVNKLDADKVKKYAKKNAVIRVSVKLKNDSIIKGNSHKIKL